VARWSARAAIVRGARRRRGWGRSAGRGDESRSSWHGVSAGVARHEALARDVAGSRCSRRSPVRDLGDGLRRHRVSRTPAGVDSSRPTSARFDRCDNGRGHDPAVRRGRRCGRMIKRGVAARSGAAFEQGIGAVIGSAHRLRRPPPETPTTLIRTNGAHLARPLPQRE